MNSSNFFNRVMLELRYIFFNSAVFLIVILAPVFYGLFYAYPYGGEIPRKVPLAVVDQDKTAMSSKLIKMFDDSEDISVYVKAESFEEAKSFFYSRGVYGIVVIPKGFTTDLYKGVTSELSMYSDGGYLLYYKQAYTGVQIAAATLGAGVVLQKLTSSGVPANTAMDLRTSVVLANYPLFNPAGGYATYVLPAVFILICHQLTLIAIGMSMGYEKNRVKYMDAMFPEENKNIPFLSKIAKNIGKLRLVNIIFDDLSHQSIDADSGKVSLLTAAGAKILVYFLMMSFQAAFLFGVVIPFFNISFAGSLVDFILLLFPFFMCVIFLGIILGSYVVVPETVILYIAAVSIPLLFLSGYPWAQSAMPEFIRLVSNILPSTHAINAAVRIYREGATLADVSGAVKTLWLMAVLLLPVALWRVNNRLKQKS